MLLEVKKKMPLV